MEGKPVVLQSRHQSLGAEQPLRINSTALSSTSLSVCSASLVSMSTISSLTLSEFRKLNRIGRIRVIIVLNVVYVNVKPTRCIGAVGRVMWYAAIKYDSTICHTFDNCIFTQSCKTITGV